MAKINDKAVLLKTALLEPIAESMGLEWHSQKVHARSVAVWWLRACNIKDKAKQAELIAKWNEIPSGFGANCSQFAQSCGRIAKASVESTNIADFLQEVEV